MSVLKDGYFLIFATDPPLSRVPLVLSGSRNQERNSILAQQFETLLKKGAIEEVHDPSTPGFYSRLFVVPKPNGEWRPVTFS